MGLFASVATVIVASFILGVVIDETVRYVWRWRGEDEQD